MRTVEVYHELSGAADSPVLVLAGPLGTTLEIWDPLVEALSERFRVLRYDHRGHGRSPAPGGSFSIVDLAVDAVALLDRLSIERAAFCGLSLGGMVGICLAANVPERLSSLVLCSSAARYDDHGPWVERAASVRWVGTAGIASDVVAGWFTPGWAAAHPEFVEQAIKMIASTPDDGYAECCTAIASWDGRKSLGRINTPTLVIGGSQDSATPVNPYAKTLVSAIYRAKLEVFDGAHLAIFEETDRAKRLITRHAAAR
ncbi:MAG: 3-oxoadipate enol-lactonase [Pseudonocardiales bacterium]|jgi:3-oxoadipate enol-lactonase|nr:3-oxoadipate enol-lactonase [Pseudonocardiales bacterium]MDT7718964.1 3-oxoadipate enol-lactonase [Pseudonocardiales bacterium]